MKAERTPAAPGPRVQGFAGRGFRVDGMTYEALLLTPEAAQAWTARALAALTEADLAPLLAVRPAPEFILLGTGPVLQRPPPALVAALEAQGIGVEALACGTPVVTSDVGGAREVIDRPQYGRLVPRDPAAIAAAVRELLADPIPQASDREGALRFSWERNSAELAAHLQELVR